MASAADTIASGAGAGAGVGGGDGEDDVPDFDPSSVKVPEEPDQRLTMALIRKVTAKAGEEQASVDAVLDAKRLRLDWQRIARIENLEAFSHVEELYLQSNRITVIDNLECLPNLRWLALSNNRIKEVSGVQHLKKLELLDLSDNRIESFSIASLPASSLRILKLSGNPCSDDPAYRVQLVLKLPNLVRLDNNLIEHNERRLLSRVLGLPISDSDESSSDDEEEEEEEEEEAAAGAGDAGDTKSDDGGDGDDDATTTGKLSVAQVTSATDELMAQLEETTRRLDAAMGGPDGAAGDAAAAPVDDAAALSHLEKRRALKARYQAKLEAQQQQFMRDSRDILERSGAKVEQARARLAEARAAAIARSKARQEADMLAHAAQEALLSKEKASVATQVKK